MKSIKNKCCTDKKIYNNTSEFFPRVKANIQSIMASEKQVNILMQLLDEALGEVDTIEGKLSSYEEMLQSVKEQMDQISQSNRLIQISNTNNGKLLDEIQFLVVRNFN